MKKYGIDLFDWVFEWISAILLYLLAISNLNYIFEWNLSVDKIILLTVTIMLFNIRQLKNIAEQVFMSFNGVGYGRMDFRMNEKGEIFFLEINFTCSVFYAQGYEGSADYILLHDGAGQRGFLERIIIEGIARYRRKEKVFKIKGNAISGYGMYAKWDLPKGTILFQGEEKSQRIVT